MFTTPERVKRISGRDVTSDQIVSAQYFVESWIGRSESDIKQGRDKAILDRATIAQVVYMMSNFDQSWEQIAASAIQNADTNIVFKAGDSSAPWIAPLAVINCAQLSWFKSRSVKTGKTIQGRYTSFKDHWVRD